MASIRDTASPELWGTMKQAYGTLYPEMFGMDHAVDVLGQITGPKTGRR